MAHPPGPVGRPSLTDMVVQSTAIMDAAASADNGAKKLFFEDHIIIIAINVERTA